MCTLCFFLLSFLKEITVTVRKKGKLNYFSFSVTLNLLAYEISTSTVYNIERSLCLALVFLKHKQIILFSVKLA